MIKDVKEILGYCNEAEINRFNDLISNYYKYHNHNYKTFNLGSHDFKSVNLVEFLKYANYYYANCLQRLNFLCYEPGDVIKVGLHKELRYGSDMCEVIKFSRGLKIRFTVTDIDKNNMRMEGYMDDNYFVTGVYYTDFNHDGFLDFMNSASLSTYINKLILMKSEICSNIKMDIIIGSRDSFAVSPNFYMH